MSTDDLNLMNVVRVAADQAFAACEVLVVIHEIIHSATHMTEIGTFP